MRTPKTSLILFISSGLLCLASWIPFLDQDKAGLEQKVRELLAQTGAMSMGKDVMDQMKQSISGNSAVPPGFFAKFQELAKPEELTELIVPVYVKHLDTQTVTSVIAFNKTPAGKKMIAAMPAITRESIVVGQTWGRALMQKVMAELRK